MGFEANRPFSAVCMPNTFNANFKWLLSQYYQCVFGHQVPTVRLMSCSFVMHLIPHMDNTVQQKQFSNYLCLL